MFFTKEHEWIKIEGNIGIIGITDYAQKELGDIVSIELPKIGARYKKGQSLAVVDSMKASSEIYAPMSGEVVEINKELEAEPQRINESPYEHGWIAKIKIERMDEKNELMGESEYQSYIEKLKKGEQ
ncbi:MAG: glycine cleavage system protein GcvH [Candidatus Micrarchaeia archaeon]